jgi:hypothetical protein
MRRWLLTVCLVVAATASAWAQPATDTARAAELYERGKRHFDLGEYGAAITHWKEAYLLSSAPLLLFNIGQAHRLSGDCAQANRFYENYQRVQPKPPNKSELEAAKAKCAGTPAATGEIDVKPVVTPMPVVTPKPIVTPRPAETTKHEQMPAVRPAPEPPPIESVPRASSPTEPTLGATPPPDATPVDSPAQPFVGSVAHVDETPGRGLRIGGMVVAGAGAASGVAAVVFAMRARSAERFIESQPDDTVWNAELEAEHQRGLTARGRARGLAVFGGLAVAAGATLWWLGHRTERGARLDVALAPGHAEVSLCAAF